VEVHAGSGIAERDEYEVAQKERGRDIDADMDADAHSDFDSYTAVSERSRNPPKQKHPAEMPLRRTSRLWIDILAALSLGTFDIMLRLVMWILRR
jgi:hypothetical protein